MSDVPVRNLTNRLDAGDWSELAAALGVQTSIKRAVDWLACHDPALALTDIVAQDEYCHDILVDYPGELFLVYDTT
jgi:hypothetical protein